MTNVVDVVDVAVGSTRGKYEIHVTDVKTFLACRRRWDWASNIRRNLQPNVTPIFFAVGKAVHEGLAQLYETGQLPEDVFTKVLREERKEFEDLTGPLWPEEQQKYDEAETLGVGMLEHYRKIVREEELDDDWETVATEMKFSVPILTENGTPSSRIFLAGRFDGVFLKKSTGELWLREYKTAGREPDPRWLELDLQSVIYCWAAQQILHQPIVGVLFRFLMKRIPEKPRRLQNGTFSRAINSQLKTTYVTYLEALQQEATRVADEKFKVVRDGGIFVSIFGVPSYLVELDYLIEEYGAFELGVFEQLQVEYADILQELSRRGSSEFLKEIEVRKTQNEIAQAARDLWIVGLEMVRPTTRIYPAPDWLKCNFCGFRAPCKVMNAGGDPEVVINAEYRSRTKPTPQSEDNKVEW